MQLTELKKVIKFKQKSWLKNIFENNNEVGARATAEVGEVLPKKVSLFSLFGKSVFGKQIEFV